MDWVIGTGTVYGKRYHTVAPPYSLPWTLMRQWCEENIGPGNVHRIWGEEKAPEPAQGWYENNAKFWFRDEEDLTLFLLRWQ